MQFPKSIFIYIGPRKVSGLFLCTYLRPDYLRFSGEAETAQSLSTLAGGLWLHLMTHTSDLWQQSMELLANIVTAFQLSYNLC